MCIRDSLCQGGSQSGHHRPQRAKTARRQGGAGTPLRHPGADGGGRRERQGGQQGRGGGSGAADNGKIRPD